MSPETARPSSPANPVPEAAAVPDRGDGAKGSVPRLAELTTFRVGGPAARIVTAVTTDSVIDAVSACDARGEPVLVLGGGSNLLVGDGGFDGTVVRLATRGVTVEAADRGGGASVRVAAGEPWDAFVAQAVRREWAGVEALSGIPGCAGATPVQNVGAYGQEISETLATVRSWDRQQGRVRTLAAVDCEFDYRHSRFKEERFRDGPRFVILEVTLQLRSADRSGPVRYAELARALGVRVGDCAPLGQVRDVVLALRRSKGMVLDEADHDTWSVGSFFTNPLLTAEVAARLPESAPRWPASGGRVKTSAAWLIEQAGFGKGFGGPGPASLSGKHTLALTNRGSATAEDLLILARHVRDGVFSRFGVRLQPEPVLVGCTL
jgi:UDP-N-acetylmuramate dehydrogenase